MPPHQLTQFSLQILHSIMQRVHSRRSEGSEAEVDGLGMLL